MNKDITIVTAFIDLGQENWTVDKGFPSYLHKTIDNQFANFANLAKLENEMFVFTDSNYFDRIAEIRKDLPTTIIEFEIDNEADDLRQQIEEIYSYAEFQRLILPKNRAKPKFWNADYLVANFFKSTMACISSIQSNNDLLAWVDFDHYNEPLKTKLWKIPLVNDRVHIFKNKDYVTGTDIHTIICNDDRHIDTSHIIASRSNWKKLEFLAFETIKGIISNKLIDDDSLILLLASLADPDLFYSQQTSKNIIDTFNE